MKPLDRLVKISVQILTIVIISGSLFINSVAAESSDYAKGQAYLDQQDWTKAKTVFDSIVKKNGENQDAALYWKAYAQAKNSEYSNALETLNSLKKRFRKSNWLDDSKALMAEIKGHLGEAAEISDDEMKLYAINSLLSSSSERAVEILSKIINSDSSDRIKKRAIFVLSQSPHQSAYSLVSKIANDTSYQGLQLVAIETLGMAGSGRALALLKELYENTESQEVKHQILKSYMVAGEKSILLTLVKSEDNFQLQKQAIRLIGVMNGSDELMELYQQKSFEKLRVDIINAIAIGGGADKLFEIARTENDQDLLLEAVHKMGIISRHKTSKKLLNLYSSQSNSIIKGAVIQTLFIQSNAKALISIVKLEKDNALKRKALKRLSMINSDEVLEFFSQSLDQ